MPHKIVTIKTDTDKGRTVETYAGAPRSRSWVEDNYAKRLHEIDVRLRRVYREAANDLWLKQIEFLDGHEKREARYRRQVEAGILTQKDFEAWMRGQLFQGRQWELKRGQLARLMTDVDKQAERLVRDGTLQVFADNADHMLFEIERGHGVMTTFGLFNADAVARLILEQPNLLPQPEIDEPRTVAHYAEVITNAVTQGILQGETLDEIALRVSEETGETGLKTLRRHARTAYTGAQNAGALISMRRARDQLGLRLQKRWRCTLDSHTRDAHADLDGQVRDIDEDFDSLLGPIAYPGDPDAEPANVENCRCWMDEFYPDGDNTSYRWADEGGEYVGDVTYKEWRRMKEEAGEE